VIPRTIHQIWVGPDPLPKEFAAYVDTWKRQHPQWEHRLWTEDDIPSDLRRREPLERIRHPAERSDILRLELLWRHGGVYVDVDMECVSPLDPHIGDADFVTAWLKPAEPGKGRVNNAFFGSVPEHPLIDHALDEARAQESHRFDKTFSGALFFDRMVKEYGQEPLILPAELIYPTSPADQQRAVCIHHQARSWKDAEGFREATVRAEKRLQKARGELEKEQRAHAKTKARLAKTEEKLDRALGKAKPRGSGEEAESADLEADSRISKLLRRR
jgi:mannosyltransferase OCH1-like enzyme